MLNNVKIWWVNVFQSQFERNLTNDDAALVEIMASTLVEMNDEQVNFRSNENGFIVQSNPPLHRIIWSWCNYMNNPAQQSPVRKNLSMGWKIFKLIIHLNNVFMTEAYWQIGMDSIQRLSSPDDILILSISGASFHDNIWSRLLWLQLCTQFTHAWMHVFSKQTCYVNGRYWCRVCIRLRSNTWPVDRNRQCRLEGIYTDNGRKIIAIFADTVFLHGSVYKLHMAWLHLQDFFLLRIVSIAWIHIERDLKGG